MATANTPASFRLLFDWTLLEAGQFKPITLVPAQTIKVAIDIPLQREYIANVEGLIQNQLYEGRPQDIHLTPLGAKYALDEIQEALAQVRDNAPELLDPQEDLGDLEILE